VGVVADNADGRCAQVIELPVVLAARSAVPEQIEGPARHTTTDSVNPA